MPEGTSLFEVHLDAGSPLAGRSLADAQLPKGTLVVPVIRGGETLFPGASTRLEAGDRLMVLAEPASELALRAFLEAAPAGG